MQTLLKEYSSAFRKPAVPKIQSGDTVRVQQLIKEGGKQRIQAFTGTVIRTRQMQETGANITVRWIASGVGVEKTVPLHSPLVKKIEVTKRGKVRRNYLTYLRERSGRSARLTDQGFDRDAVNVKEEEVKPEPIDSAQGKQKAEDQADAEVTELKEDSSVETEGSTEEVAKEEDKAAASDEPAEDASAETDEQQAPAEEVESGEAKAADEDTRSQE